MSLRSKIVFLLLAVVLSYGLTDFFVQRHTIGPIFDEVESQEAIKDIERVQHALRAEIDNITRDCKGLAAWRATWEFAEHASEDFIESNLGPAAFERYDLDLIYISNPKGKVLWGGMRDPAWEAGVDLSRILSDAVVLMRAQAGKSLSEDSTGGYVPRVNTSGLRATQLGPLFLCTRPITVDGDISEARGAVTVGRILDAECLRELRENTGVQFNLWSFGDQAMPQLERELLDNVSSSYEPLLVEADSEILHVYASMNDMASAPAFLIRVDVDRSISRSGRTALRFAWNSTVVAGLLMLLALVLVLQKLVLRPLSRLTRHVEAIGLTEDVHARLNLNRADELGILSREFDGMMDKLAQSRADLVEAAREAGMSEIATGILHNVGNTLNSVNVSAAVLAEKISSFPAAKDLGAVVEILDQHAESLPEFVQTEQGSHLRPFLSGIHDSLDQDLGDLVGEVESLTSGIDHIRELIQSQQSYAGRSSLVESVLVEELVQEALVITERALAPDPALTTECEIEQLPRAMLDRHKVLEILVNLIQNARQALKAADTSPRQLTLRALRVEAGEQQTLLILVTDNGIGIDSETAKHIFNMGFTTRHDGHGFGLHGAANSATEMGGNLTVLSEGLGLGATFRLELPFEAAQSASAQR